MMDLTPQNNHSLDDSIDTPTVSILMPCYNVEETIDEAVVSLLSQILREHEIIAVDDGSSDSTGERLMEWMERDSRVRGLSLSHGGIIPTLNAGLAACRAPLVARMDVDDRAHPERLARQVAYLETYPDLALVSCLVEGFPADQVQEGFRLYIDWLNSLIKPEAIEREIFIESPLVHPSVMIRKIWIERIGGYQDHGWPEDYDLWLRMYMAGARFAKVPEVLLYWREHPTRLTRTDTRYSTDNLLRAKAHYICQGPLCDRDAIIIWGAGKMGRRMSKYLLRRDVSITAFVDIDPAKIGRSRRGKPIISPEELIDWWSRYDRPVVLVAVGSRGARELIRQRLNEIGLLEGDDWWAVA
jgi:glycosyltransferase involved in cell wall biosynthesis